MTMTTHNFRLVLEGVDLTDDAVLDALFNAGCEDATFGAVAGVPYAEFDRAAEDFVRAVFSAIAAVEAAPGIRVIRVEPDELVGVSEIAERVDRSRESVRLLSEGKRGRGDFPAPALLLHGRQPLWHWADVAKWFNAAGQLDVEALDRAEFLAAVNGALEVRRHMPQVPADAARAVSARLLDLPHG